MKSREEIKEFLQKEYPYWINSPNEKYLIAFEKVLVEQEKRLLEKYEPAFKFAAIHGWKFEETKSKPVFERVPDSIKIIQSNNYLYLQISENGKTFLELRRRIIWS